MIARLSCQSRCGASGFTLIEVLVAVLVLSVGLLGLVGLQGVALKMNHGAYVRSQASNLAYDIADAMRANRANAASYAGIYAAVACVLDYTRLTSGPAAAADIGEWRNRLACLLPSGSATIVIPAGTRTPTITVTWDETRYGGGSAEAFAYTTEL